VTIDTLYSRLNGIDGQVDALLANVDTIKEDTTGVDQDLADLIKKIKGGGNLPDTMTAADIQTLTSRLNSVSSSIGIAGGDSSLQTVLGKLNKIEQVLIVMGTDGSLAKAFNQNARQKAGNITQFIRLLTTELKEEGTVENLEEKMGILEGYLVELREAVSEIPASVTSISITDSVADTLDELREITKDNDGLGELMRLVDRGMSRMDLIDDTKGSEVAGIQGLTPEEMLEMRNDVNELQSLMLEIRSLLDSEVNKPVVHGWLEGI